MEAPDQPALIDQLHSLGHVPLRVEEVARSPFVALAGGALLPAHRLRLRTLGLVTGQLATLLRAGVPLDEALHIIEELVDAGFERACIGALLEKISAGATVADAMAAQAHVFPEYCISIVRAGEASANLDAALERIADFVDRSRATRAHITSALLYPVIVALACIASLAIVLLVVLPQFRPLFIQAGDSLPLSTRYLMDLSTALSNYWWLALPILLAGAAAIVWHLRRPQSRLAWRRRLLRAPVIGDLLCRIEVARFSRTLGTLLKNGVSLLSALAVTRDAMTGTTLAEATDVIIDLAKGGKGLAQPMQATGAFPAVAVYLVRIGEESGRHDEMLLKIADLFESETRRSLDRLLALVAPTVTVLLGVVVATVFMSLMSAVLSVYNLAM